MSNYLHQKELPAAFCDRMKTMLGNDFEHFVKALSEKPAISWRINPNKPFHHFDTTFPVAWNPLGYYLTERPEFVLDPYIHAGCYYVQEASSMFVGYILRQIIAEKPIKVLDFCAAPGGKSTDALAYLPEGSLLVSNEIDGVRVQALLENIKKWGYENVIVTQSSAQDFGRIKNFFDVIILDAPCSGEGMFRKDEDAVERWSPSLVRQCSELQRSIIDDLIGALKPGGHIIYSTCTFAPEEDEMMINYLQELGLTSVAMPVPAEWQITETEANDAVCYRFYPHKTKGEGFFAACLQKAEHGSNNFKAKKHRSVQKLSAAEKQQVMPFLKENNQLALLKENKNVIAFPQDLLPDLEALQSKVKVLYYGILVGQLTPKELVPAHELALSKILNENLAFVALEKNDAIRFLQKNPIENATITQKGWQLVRYKEVNLGWIKALDNRINNHYPQHFKIRKQG